MSTSNALLMKYTRCIHCGDMISVRRMPIHLRSACRALEPEREKRRAEEKAARYERRNATRRAMKDAAPRIVDGAGSLKCAHPACDVRFMPKNKIHRCCSQRCRDSYKDQPPIRVMFTLDERLEHQQDIMARHAEEAAKRLKTTE